MTNPNYSVVGLILDRSGSMATMREVVVQGVNTFLDAQRKGPDNCDVSLCLFNHSVELTYTAKPLSAVPNLRMEDYIPGGDTALYDAICQTIDATGARLAALPEAERPGLVTMLIVTDGHENSSKKFTRDDVKRRIEHQQKAYGWVFQFVGAEAHSITEAVAMGVHTGNASLYSASALGTKNTFMAAGASVLRGRNVKWDAANVMNYTASEASAMGASEP